MLIFNRNEEENSFKTKDNEILQIESTLPLKDFAQRLQNTLAGREGGLLSEEYEMLLFRSGVSRQVEFLSTDYGAQDDALYRHTFNPEEEEGLDTVTHKRAPLYEEFERYTYGQNHDFVQVPEETWRLEDIYNDVMDALGVMPTLQGKHDVPVKHLVELSYLGQQLYFPWEDLNASNRLPEYEDLEMYYQMSPYERAVMTDSMHNPTRLMDIVKAVRALPGWKDFTVTREFVHEAVQELGLTPAEIAGQKQEALTQLTARAQEAGDCIALNDAFKAKFNRTPRILPEIYQAFLDAFHTDRLSEEQQAYIVDTFKLSNIQKVAGRHNSILLVLAGELNYDAVKAEHLDIFASYLTAADYPRLKESGFFDWYERYRGEVKTSDLVNIVKNADSLQFDVSLSPKQLLSLSRQIRGWCNAACVYEQYGIDFRDAVVAIPGRGLVVEDKAQHIRMYILDNDDARVFTVGQDCHCCQNLAIRGDQTYGDYYSGEITEDLLSQHFTSIDAAYDYVHENYSGDSLITPGAGGSCVANELTNPLCWVTIWEDTNTGNTIAQADTHYVPEGNALVYDNIEFVNDGNVKKLYDIIAVYARESQFDTIHVGTGYNQQMASFGKRIATKEFINYKNDLTDEYMEKFGRDSVYSDYSSSAVKIKQKGEVLIFPKRADSNFKIEHREEDNEAFRHLTHPLSTIFSSRSAREKMELITRYDNEELRAEELEAIAKKKPELLKDYEILPLSVQKEILYQGGSDMICENLSLIRHPDSLLIEAALEARPNNILHFNEADTTVEHWKAVLEKDGSLLEYCPERYWQEEVIITAIKSNPFSIKYIAGRLDEPLRSKMIRMAVYKKPIIAAHFPDIPEYVWIQICQNRPDLGKYCPRQTFRVQEAMVTKSPYAIDDIRDPDPRIVAMAAQKIPTIKSNPLYASYFGSSAQAPRTRRSTSHSHRNATPQAPAPVPAPEAGVREALTADLPPAEIDFSMDEIA